MSRHAVRARSSVARWLSLSSLSVAALSCAAPSAPAQAPLAVAAPPVAPKPALAAADTFGSPPPATATPDVPFPTIDHDTLDSGLALRVVTRKTYPIVELRLVLFSGTASDGKEPGVADMTGELLKAGGAGSWNAADLSERAESLGSSLDIETGRDSTQISMAVTTGDFDAALDLLGAVAQKPRFAPAEFAKLKQRELDRVQSAAKSSASWAGSMVMYRQLFASADGAQPYAHFDATAKELGAITLEGCKRWYQDNVTPANATLVIAGDVDLATAQAAVRRVFYGWKGARPKPPVFDAPALKADRLVWLVDRPHSAQSQIYVAGFGPERKSPSWPAVAAANQILGGGVAGRLFLDVREKRSLAYSTSSSLDEAAHGPEPIVLSAGTQTAKTGLAVQALLDNLNQIATTPPSTAEVGSAARYLSDSFLFRTETVGALAGLTAKLAVLDLPDTYYDSYRHALQKLDVGAVFGAAQTAFMFDGPLIVVAGAASRIAKPLSHFAEVRVVDPEHEFRTVRSVPRTESEPLSAP